MKRSVRRLSMVVALVFISLLWNPAFCAGEPEGIIRIRPESGLVILLPANPTSLEKDAAALLSRMLEKSLGADFTVVSEKGASTGDRLVIAVGRTQAAEKSGILSLLGSAGAESIGIGVWAEKSLICIAGKEDLATHFAVARFLEKYAAIRWFFPDDLGLSVPRKGVMEIPSGTEVQTPDFPMRWVGKDFAASWAVFNGMNTNMDERGGFHVFKSAHTFHDFLPPEKYFKSHPEYFSEIKGERKPKQLCTSNREVIDLVAKAMIRMFDEQATLDMITLFPEDGRSFCECSRCRSLDDPSEIAVTEVNSPRWKELSFDRHRALSRRMTIFYREVTGSVLSARPNKKIQVGAYSSYLHPPKNFQARLHPNVFVLMCHGFCHNHPLESASCEANRRFRDAMNGWRRIYSGMTIYEYYRKGSHLDLPFPILHSIKKDIPFLKREGVFGFYTQFTRDQFTNGLNYYLATRLLWNSREDADGILDDFYKNFYGQAWQPMKEYWENYERNAIAVDMHLACPVNQLDKLFPGSLLDKQAVLLDRALKAADGPEVKERVARARISLNYVKMCMEYLAEAKETPGALKGIKNRDRKRAPRQASEDLSGAAERIAEFRESNRKSGTFGGKSNFIDRFLRPKWIVRNLVRSFEEEADD
ncbi:MAG: hypothetical protein CVU57_11945 [Deltaproteobacteria bacterium HGW-Deltaproteobacteria-15]|nr:MAG: hypothetical protein CVU57_11945 [Deltaproteobacteria bacterium HGW-Deltaproteobacteria-15]